VAHEQKVIAECQELYCYGLLSPEEIAGKTGVSLASFYRWRREGRWDAAREAELGLRHKVGGLVLKLVDEAVKAKDTDASKLYGIVKLLKTFQATGEIKERLVYAEDAEKLVECMKEMPVFKDLLEDPAVLSELSELMKAKIAR